VDGGARAETRAPLRSERNSMSQDAAPLFTPVKIGDLTLPNRIAMAPLTRNRAIDPNTVPSPLAPL
jgi:2,4-dienoyl-CoA reductase-like NADH-dependent reductase (Old Yellow Enzyme family)